MSSGAREEFEPAHRESLRARFVIDRIDGRPVLTGHARCPHCEVKLRRDAQGRMDLGETAVRVEFRVHCPACGRSLEIADEFEWGP